VALEIGLDGAVVLVTGGVRGVGLGITRAFLSAGARVVTCARRTPEEPVGDAFLPCDIRDPDAVGKLVDEIVARFGSLDVLVNNAGGAPLADTATASPRFHEKVIGLNLVAPLNVAVAANAVMQKQETGGVIVNVSSINATRPSPRTASYGAAKAGLDNLTTTLAVEWAPKVRVNVLDVGLVRTDITEQYGDLGEICATVPMGRMAEPGEVGNCAVFLASPLASYVSGARLAVHGGGELPEFFSKLHNGQE
jgi:NAD(P)-dependent dehydrogenase (short-subunit alcohol dehydrogenase family)